MELKTVFSRPCKMLALGIVVLLAICLAGFTTAKKQIIILADGQSHTLETRALKPLTALEEAGIKLNENDGYFVVNKPRVEAGAIIEVVRAMPLIVWQDGTETEYSIGRGTVREALQALNIDFREKIVYPALDTKPVAGMEITVVSKKASLKEEREAVPFAIERRPDSHLARGEQKTLVGGEDGEKIVKAYYVDVNGQTVKRVVGETVVRESKNEIVAIGSGLTIETSRGATHYRERMLVEATAYSHGDGSGHGVTSIGLAPRRGIIAVDPDIIPYWTKVYIPGYGFAVAGDTGGAMVGKRIDLFMDTYNEAISFGRRNVELYILE